MNDFLRRARRLLMLKEHFFIWLFVILVSVGMLLIQGSFGQIDKEFALSLVPNIIADMISIIIATYIISILLQKREETKSKTRVYKMLGKRFDKLLYKIGTNYINYVTKEPCSVKAEPNNRDDLLAQIERIIVNIESHIKDDFISQHVKVLVINQNVQSGNFNDLYTEMNIGHHDFTQYFKQEVSMLTGEFTSRYISVLPDDLREKIFRLEDLLLSELFFTQTDLRFPIDLRNAKYDLTDLRHVFKVLGEEIYGLLTYFEDIKEDKLGKKS